MLEYLVCRPYPNGGCSIEFASTDLASCLKFIRSKKTQTEREDLFVFKQVLNAAGEPRR